MSLSSKDLLHFFPGDSSSQSISPTTPWHYNASVPHNSCVCTPLREHVVYRDHEPRKVELTEFVWRTFRVCGLEVFRCVGGDAITRSSWSHRLTSMESEGHISSVNGVNGRTPSQATVFLAMSFGSSS